MDRKFEEKYLEFFDNGVILRFVLFYLYCFLLLKFFCLCIMYIYVVRINLIEMLNYKFVWVLVICFKCVVFFYINIYLGDRDKSLEECLFIN